MDFRDLGRFFFDFLLFRFVGYGAYSLDLSFSEGGLKAMESSAIRTRKPRGEARGVSLADCDGYANTSNVCDGCLVHYSYENKGFAVPLGIPYRVVTPSKVYPWLVTTRR